MHSFRLAINLEILVLDLHQSSRQRECHEAGHKSVAIIQRYTTVNDDVKLRDFYYGAVSENHTAASGHAACAAS